MRRIMAALAAVRDECTLARWRMHRRDLCANDRALARTKYNRLRKVLSDAEKAVQETIRVVRP